MTYKVRFERAWRPLLATIDGAEVAADRGGGGASSASCTPRPGWMIVATAIPIMTAICREVFLQTPKLHEEAALALGPPAVPDRFAAYAATLGLRVTGVPLLPISGPRSGMKAGHPLDLLSSPDDAVAASDQRESRPS